jgi:predicted nucleic acid-binding protein
VALNMAEPRFLLDTNVIIGLLNGHADSTALIQAANCDLANMAVSQITRMELLGFAGMGASEEQTLQNLLAAVHVILLDEAIEMRTIALRRQHKIKLPDAIIAATATSRGLVLLSMDKALNKIANP